MKKYAGYKEGRESMKEERRESKGLQRYEGKKSMEKPMKGRKSGKKC